MRVQTYFNEDLYNLEISASHNWSIWCSGMAHSLKLSGEAGSSPVRQPLRLCKDRKCEKIIVNKGKALVRRDSVIIDCR